MSKLGFGIAGLATLFAWTGCSDSGATYPDVAEGGHAGAHASGGHAGSAGNAGSLPSGAGVDGGGASGAAGAESADSGEGGTIDAGGSAGEAGSESSDAGAAGASSEPVVCGGSTLVKCPTGQFCDLSSDCGSSANALGVCVPLGKVDDCDDNAGPDGPSCGCEGKFYANDCQRRAFGMLKAPSGTCSGIASYPTAYGVWQTTSGTAAKGPAVVITAARFARTWDSVSAFAADAPPPNPSGTIPLTLEDSDDLFLRLAGVPAADLPHQPGSGSGCHAVFYFRLCDGCALRAVSYDSAAQVSPEMDFVWPWFDRILGPSATSNPASFCH
ncbi:MAG TPA: hypothetical protein VFK05_35380 [Polyangiaceae bacterium]|nr:hypothetical protein [Polyangiaceae bacterium]